MNIQNMLLNLIVFALPIIALIYVSVGIKLLKLKVGGSLIIFPPDILRGDLCPWLFFVA